MVHADYFVSYEHCFTVKERRKRIRSSVDAVGLEAVLGFLSPQTSCHTSLHTFLPLFHILYFPLIYKLLIPSHTTQILSLKGHVSTPPPL